MGYILEPKNTLRWLKLFKLPSPLGGANCQRKKLLDISEECMVEKENIIMKRAVAQRESNERFLEGQ